MRELLLSLLYVISGPKVEGGLTKADLVFLIMTLDCQFSIVSDCEGVFEWKFDEKRRVPFFHPSQKFSLMSKRWPSPPTSFLSSLVLFVITFWMQLDWEMGHFNREYYGSSSLLQLGIRAVITGIFNKRVLASVCVFIVGEITCGRLGCTYVVRKSSETINQR